MNLSKYSSCLDVMYKDKFTIKRYVEIENNDGSTDSVLNEDEALSNIKCRISILKEDEADLKNIDINNQVSKFKIFCPLEIDIRKGDSIELFKIVDDVIVEKYQGEVAKPVKFDLGQEFIFIENRIS